MICMAHWDLAFVTITGALFGVSLGAMVAAHNINKNNQRIK